MVSNAQESAEERRTMLSVKDVNIRYGKESALRNVSFDVLENEIFAIIGPAIWEDVFSSCTQSHG